MNVVSDLALEGNPPVPETAPKEHPLLSDIQSGKFDGIYLPAGFDMSEAKSLIPDWDSAMKLGLDFYDPESEDVELVIFNPEKIKADVIKKADFEGTLKDVLRPADAYFKTGVVSPGGEAAGTAPPEGRVATMPMSGGTPDQALTNQRAKNATDVSEPSKRAIPGAGVILNDLVKRAI
jgi:hypothetical protein